MVKAYWDTLQLDHIDAEKPGHHPWLIGVRKYGCLYGPSVMPHPGMFTLLGTFDKQCFIVLLPVSLLLTNGLSIADGKSWLESPHGGKEADKGTKLVSLEPWSALAVDNGWIPIPLFLDGHDPKAPQDDRGAKANATAVCHLWGLAIDNAANVNAMSNCVRRAVANYNKTHLDKKTGDALWKNR